MTQRLEKLHQKAIDRLLLQVGELHERANDLEELTKILKLHPKATEDDFDRYAKQTNASDYGDYAPEPNAMPYGEIRHWLEVNTYGDDDDDEVDGSARDETSAP